MGSRAYGLAGPDSDVDQRGCYLSTDIKNIIGLNRHDHQTKQSKDEDSFYFELRHFLNNLRKSTTSALELLFNETWTEITPDWQYIQANRIYLINTEKTYNCLRGYIFGEKKLILGIRSGELGSKRKESLEKYGYSPKNLVNLIRLCFCGGYFFQTGFFPVNIQKINPDLAVLLMGVKNNPGSYNNKDALFLADQWEAKLEEAFENRDRSKDLIFNEEFANEIVYKLYMPVLNSVK